MEENWQGANKAKDVYWLKKHVELVLNRLNTSALKGRKCSFSFLDNAYSIVSKKIHLANSAMSPISYSIHLISKQRSCGVEFDWDAILRNYIAKDITYSEYSKYPSAKRDLALLLDKDIEFSNLKKLAFQTESKLLKSVNLFDVYEGEKLPQGKKSYASELHS